MKIIMTKGEISAVKGLMDKLGIDFSILSFSNLEMETKYASIKIEGDEVVADVNPEYYKDIVDFTAQVVSGFKNLPWDKIVKNIGGRFFARLAKAWKYLDKAWQELIKADFDSAVDKFLNTPEVEALDDELEKKAKTIEQKWGCQL
jgi:hypothetical protein